MTAFAGWPQEAITWFRGLEADNSKEYFSAHRHTYETCVKGPLQALIVAVEDEFGAGMLFRPNRDVRFSVDKSPYKTHTAAVVGGAHRVGYYLDVSAEGLVAGGGYHAMDREQLARFRAAVARDDTGPELLACLADAQAAGLAPFGATLRTAPRGYPVDHPRIEVLRRKSLALIREAPEGLLHTPAALPWVVETWRALRPVQSWLDEHVGVPVAAR